MKTFSILLVVTFGTIFWRHPQTVKRDWPDGMPHFASATATCALNLKQGAFVCFETPRTAAAILEEARAAYHAAGWEEARIHPADTLLFTKGNATAAVLAETRPALTRVTAYQRNAQ